MILWSIIGFLNAALAVIELIVALKRKDKHSSYIHIMYSLMFVSYSVSAFNLNLLYGVPGLIIGLLAIFLNSKYRRKKSIFQ